MSLLPSIHPSIHLPCAPSLLLPSGFVANPDRTMHWPVEPRLLYSPLLPNALCSVFKIMCLCHPVLLSFLSFTHSLLCLYEVIASSFLVICVHTFCICTFSVHVHVVHPLMVQWYLRKHVFHKAGMFFSLYFSKCHHWFWFWELVLEYVAKNSMVIRKQVTVAQWFVV